MLKSGAKIAVKQAAKSGRRVLASDLTKKVAKKAMASAKSSMKKGAINAAINAFEGKNVKTGMKEDLRAAKRDLGVAIKKGLKGENGDNGHTKNGQKGGGRRWKKKNIAAVGRVTKKGRKSAFPMLIH